LSAADQRVLELLEPESRERARPAAAGYLDLLEADLPSTGPTQDLMLTGIVPSIYERWWRPALGRVFKGLTGPGMEEEIRIARLLLGLSSGHSVLDVACGPGNFTRAFGRAVGEEGLAVGVDASETMLARGSRDNAAAGAGNVVLVRADATALPFEDACFDAACCFAALHLFEEPLEALGEMARVLAPGGRIAIMTSVRRPIAPSALVPAFERATGMRVFEPDEIVAALRRAGFAEVRRRVSGLIQFVGGRLSG
jgi:ubiquinone/menaquinone biosynthesis C-methylase UbiE